MTRELNQLIKKLKTLAPEDIARVQQYLQQLKSQDQRGVPVELKAVNGEVRAEVAGAAGAPDSPADEPVRQQRQDADAPPDSPEAAVAQAACEQWRRRPFQAIDADDLQPIAALFREAVDTRAASRFRFGSR